MTRPDLDTAGKERAEAIARKLRALRDARMRSVSLAGMLVQLAADDAVDTLFMHILGAVRDGQSEHTVVIEALNLALTDPELLTYEHRSKLYRAAKQRGHEIVSRLLFDSSPLRDDQRHLAATEREPERSLLPRGRPLTLGERKALARSHRRDMLRLLVRDPHPDVVEILLGNPHVTERDVLAIAARRPASPGALTTVAMDARWGLRYSVKCALVKNPYTPTHLAVRIVLLLRPADLRAVSGDRRLAAALRDQARSLLALGAVGAAYSTAG